MSRVYTWVYYMYCWYGGIWLRYMSFSSNYDYLRSQRIQIQVNHNFSLVISCLIRGSAHSRSIAPQINSSEGLSTWYISILQPYIILFSGHLPSIKNTCNISLLLFSGFQTWVLIKWQGYSDLHKNMGLNATQQSYRHSIRKWIIQTFHMKFKTDIHEWVFVWLPIFRT